MLNPEPSQDPALAIQRVIESAIELTRAEVGLGLARGRALVVKLVSVVLAVIFAVAAAQVALVLLALSPVLYERNGFSALLFALLPAVCLTALGAWGVLRLWNGFKSAAGSAAAGGER